MKNEGYLDTITLGDCREHLPLYPTGSILTTGTFFTTTRIRRSSASHQLNSENPASKGEGSRSTGGHKPTGTWEVNTRNGVPLGQGKSCRK